MKNWLILLIILLFSFSFVFGGITLANNHQMKMYKFLEEKGHDVAYLDYGLVDYCGYRKYGIVVDCNYEYNNAVALDLFASQEKQE